jgi:hypothetical protein
MSSAARSSASGFSFAIPRVSASHTPFANDEDRAHRLMRNALTDTSKRLAAMQAPASPDHEVRSLRRFRKRRAAARSSGLRGGA